MRWKKISNLIIVVFFSIVFTIEAGLNLISPDHMVQINVPGAIFHPFASLGYWASTLIIMWGLYFYVRKKPSERSFILLLIVGIILIFGGLFLLSVADHYEDVVFPLPR